MRGLELVGGRRAVVPVVVVFHEGDVLAFDGVGDYRGGLAVLGGVFHGFDQGVDVVAIDLGGVPAESGPFRGQGTQGQNLVAAAGGLPFVVIDDGRQVVELLGRGE